MLCYTLIFNPAGQAYGYSGLPGCPCGLTQFRVRLTARLTVCITGIIVWEWCRIRLDFSRNQLFGLSPKTDDSWSYPCLTCLYQSFSSPYIFMPLILLDDIIICSWCSVFKQTTNQNILKYMEHDNDTVPISDIAYSAVNAFKKVWRRFFFLSSF
jgi:hypothetical protein